MHCKDCKWWDYDPSMVGDDGRGKCKLTESYDGVQKWPTLAVAQDDDDWHACLYTAPEFGCVQFHSIDRNCCLVPTRMA